MFFLLLAGYLASFSFDSGDALDAARWMESGELHRLVEFRHLVQRLLPYWLWQGLRALGLATGPLGVLRGWDLVTAAASVMLLYCLLKQVTGSRVAQFLGCFFYATAHAVWGFAGSGRLYSTSLLLAFGAFYLALSAPRLRGARHGLAVAAAGTLVCFAGMFWLVHVFNAVGVGLVLLLLPVGIAWRRRLGNLMLYGTAGLAVLLAVGVSSLRYAGIELTLPSVQQWIAGVETPPTRLDALSPMRAAYGQAHGILALPNLTYMINGLLRADADLLAVGSLPWQLGKFVFVAALLALVYVYPWLLLRKAEASRRGLILALYAPLLINLYFALAWLGTDRQRFLPSMFSVVALGVLSGVDLAARLRRPRAVATGLTACVIFIAAVNFAEVILPSQRKFIVLVGAWEPLRHSLRPADLLLDFGRDIDYQPVITYYARARYLSLSNDVTYYDWDRPDWQQQVEQILRRTEAAGGRLFVMDRLARGSKPVAAAWSEKQHPRPTVKEFAEHLRASYCVTPGFYAGEIHYYRIAQREENCPAKALPGQ